MSNKQTNNSKQTNNEYTVDSIQVLDDIQHIRLRKGMYIGETYDPHHLFSEAFDNAIDEAQSGNSDLTIIKKFKDENGKLHYYVRDHGRGIPIGKILYGEKEVEALQILFTKCNSGAKFSSDNYRICSGTHGVGGVCICALSEWMKVTTIRDHKSVSLITELGEVRDLVYTDTDEENGVEIEFIPDPSEFESSEIPDSFIIDRCEVAQAMGYPIDLFINNKKIEIKINSLLDLIHLQPDVTEYCSDVIKVRDESTGESLIVGFKYTSDTKYRISGYTNLLYNSYGGTHTRCTIDAITQAWSKYTEERSLVWDDCLLGMKIVVAAFIDNIAFSSQTKDKLTVPKSQLKTLTDLFSLKFEEWIESHKNLCTKLLDRFSEYRAAQRKLESQKEIMNVVQISKKDKSGRLRRGSSVVSSLIDCTSPSKENTELYICLAGDTKIKMLDGTSPTLEELTERYKDPDEEFWVYSCDDSGEFIPAKAHNPRLTRYVDELYEISLSDGTTVKCTGNHKFMNKETMDWIRADEMTVGTSLHCVADMEDGVCACAVVSIKRISSPHTPVYCMTVDSTHRFALENGLISKNCEGLSASGSIARPRNKEFQAVLPLRGKIKNIAGYSLKDALKFETVANIVNSIGCGIGESADPEKSRYDKIIISADKDSDGSHIVALVLTAIVNLLPSIVKAGMVYILDAPFYKYWTKDGKHHYTSDFDEVPQWSFDNHKFLRFKGLGSMDDSDFKDACLNAENRVLFQVEYPDDLERFNHLAGTSAGRNELLSHYGVIRSISDLEEDEFTDEES